MYILNFRFLLSKIIFSFVQYLDYARIYLYIVYYTRNTLWQMFFFKLERVSVVTVLDYQSGRNHFLKANVSLQERCQYDKYICLCYIQNRNAVAYNYNNNNGFLYFTISTHKCMLLEINRLAKQTKYNKIVQRSSEMGISVLDNNQFLIL